TKALLEAVAGLPPKSVMLTVIVNDPGFLYVCPPWTLNWPAPVLTKVAAVGAVPSPPSIVVGEKSLMVARGLPSTRMATPVVGAGGWPLTVVRLVAVAESGASPMLAVLMATAVLVPMSPMVTVTMYFPNPE